MFGKNIMTITRKQRKAIREFKAKAKRDIAYFLFCGIIFYALVQAITPVAKNTATSIIAYVTATTANAMEKGGIK